MFLEVIIIASMGLAAIVTALLLGGQDAHDLKTVGVGMVGASIGVWTAGRGIRANSNGKNGNGHPPDYASIEVESKK